MTQLTVDANAHAHRKLRNVAKFKPLGLRHVPPVAVAYSLDHLALSDGESILGVYENAADSLDGAIVFTDQRCHVYWDGERASFAYSEINRVSYGKFTTDKLDTLVVVDLHNGRTVQFDVAGFAVHEHGAKTFDSYAIGAFLEAASSA